jgi:predicted acylesterase/phospholipase RssA
MVIKHIVLSGGAYKGLYELGCLKYLSQRGFYDINNIRSIHGTSIGGLIGVLLCMKMDWETLDNYVINRPWYKITNVSPMMMFDILPKKGLLGNEFFKSALEPVLKSQHMDNEITLKDLYELTNIELNLYTIELNSFELINLSHKTHPNMTLINAVHMTCCLPYIFQPVWYNNSYYIDGGLMNNYPIEKCIDDNEISKKEILGIKFNTTDLDVRGKLCEDSNIFEYGYFLYKKLVRTHNIKQSNYHTHKNSIYELIIPCKELDVNDGYETIMNSDIRAKYIEDGVKYAEVFYSYLEKDNRLPTEDSNDNSHVSNNDVK